MISKTLQEKLKEVLKTSLRAKFQKYTPEPAVMPFHTRLLGKDRMALFSFIHSLNTNFGTTIFEPIARELASNKFKEASTQQVSGRIISSKAQEVIGLIMTELSSASCLPSKEEEIKRIKAVCREGQALEIKPTKVDLKLISQDDIIYLIDLKAAKPNSNEFKQFKRTLLEWIATVLWNNPEQKVESLIAIPYNPYEPQPYARWTMRGMLDLERELKVAEGLWDFLSGEKGTYHILLNIFETVGIELRPEIDAYFAKYNLK